MTSERHDFISALDKHRGFLRYTVNGLNDEQAARRTTVSELCLGGLIKHVAAVEEQWCRFIEEGPAAFATMDADAYSAHAATFRMEPGETLAAVLEHYDEVANRTGDLVTSVPSLDADHPLPEAPWFEAGARWSVRRALLHILAETSQHAGHADVLREALDGQKTMG